MEYSNELYRQILGIERPWRVSSVEFDRSAGDVDVEVSHDRSEALLCPECGTACPGYDRRERRWRHLDTCGYRTFIRADVPRVHCSEHGVRMVTVPWAESGEKFTVLFESFAIVELLHAESRSSAAERLRVDESVVERIEHRAVARGLARREAEPVEHVCVDETSFRKRHEYATIVSDHDRGTVLHVAPKRSRESLQQWLRELSGSERRAIGTVSMDMHAPYIAAVHAELSHPESTICFDLFHIARHIGTAVDRVRRAEHKRLSRAGNTILKGTRYLWLHHPDRLDDRRWEALKSLERTSLKTARAWRFKEYLMNALTTWCRRDYVREALRRWYNSAIRTTLKPIKAVARTIKEHTEGILNAVWHRKSNGPAESINARIQKLKRKANGYRSIEAFRTAIYFHLGGLDLHPDIPHPHPLPT